MRTMKYASYARFLRSCAIGLLMLSALFGGAGPAIATPDDVAGELDARTAEAMRLTTQAQEFQEKNNVVDALANYLEARKLTRRFSNVYGAAQCLEALNRLDEALERYQEVIQDFSDFLSERNRAKIM